MAAKRKPDKSKLTYVDPYIRVKDVARSADWYKRMLGFQIAMAMPNKKSPSFVRMHAGGDQDGVALMIGDGGDAISGKKATALTRAAISSRKAQRVVTFYYRVDRNIDDFFASVKRKKAKVTSPIQDMEYGMREFTIRDPDGYDITIAQNL